MPIDNRGQKRCLGEGRLLGGGDVQYKQFMSLLPQELLSFAPADPGFGTGSRCSCSCSEQPAPSRYLPFGAFGPAPRIQPWHR